MAVRYEDQCCDCGLPCLGDSCKNRNVPIWYCDKCGAEDEDLYEYEGQELCLDCIREQLPCIHTRY